MLSTAMILAASITLGQANDVSPHYEHLKGLEQLAGEWEISMSQDGDEVFKGTASNKWTNDKSFLVARYFGENGEYVASEVFGWDAATEKIRLWSFVPGGGRNEAVISVQGNVFSGDYTMIEPDGTKEKAVVKGEFTDNKFNVVLRRAGAPVLKGTYRRK